MPQRSFWKKNEFVIVVLLTLALIYVIVLLNQKINFLLGNELIVYLLPHQLSFSAHYGDVNEIKFNISIDNAAYCRASCSYSFNDRGKNEAVDKGNFEIGKKEYRIRAYNLSVKRLGSGQDIYSFDVECRSIRTYLCLTKSDKKSRSSLAVVNYDLTESEKELKEIIKQKITGLLLELKETDIMHQQVNGKFFELGFRVNMQNLTRQKIITDDFYDRTRVEIENLKSLWYLEEYLKLDELLNESLSQRLNETRKSLAQLNRSVDELIALHNSLLFQLKKIYETSAEIGSIIGVMEENIQQNFNAGLLHIYETASSLTNNTFENYSAMTEEINESDKNQRSLAESIRAPALNFFFDVIYNLNFEQDLLCLKTGCGKNNTAAQMISGIERFNRYYPDSSELEVSCSSLIGFAGELSRARNESLSFIEKNNISFPDSNEFRQLASSFEDNLMRDVNNSYFNLLKTAKENNATAQEIFDVISPFFPENETFIPALTFNESTNISLHLLSKSHLSEKSKRLADECMKTGNNLPMNLSLEPISAEINYTATSGIEVALGDNPPICCLFSECKPCCINDSCRNDAKTFPVILLHGHSFAKSNSPEFSLDSFNKLQAEMQDDGYLNAGIVSLYSKNEPLEPGEWGLSGKPVTVKVSYYYDSFRKDDKYIVVPTKSENIDTYSLRLKELIDIVKQRTNKPKVNIIAHSMGGLVARRYVQIFGEEDIDKLVMIAAPNNGISGSAGSYCGVIGESRECADMRKNSLFLNKLNDPFNQPKKVKISNIIGTGCTTDGKESDGVVPVEDAGLDNSKLYFVNGSCEGFDRILHTEILDIDVYPETYNIVAGILKE